jgi:hypothetical protein
MASLFTLLASPALGQSATVPTVSGVEWSRNCVTMVGEPAFTFSPDRRVLSVLFQGLAAGARPLPPRIRCEMRWDVRVPDGKRGEFKGAVYRVSVFAPESSEGRVTVRHGRKGPLWFSRWGPRVVLRAREGNEVEDVSSAGRLTTPCGGRATYLAVIELAAPTGKTGDAARVDVDSLDFDSGVDWQFALKSC